MGLFTLMVCTPIICKSCEYKTTKIQTGKRSLVLFWSGYGMYITMIYSTVPSTRVDSSFLYGFIGGKASSEVAVATELTKQSKRVPGICFVLPNNSFFPGSLLCLTNMHLFFGGTFCTKMLAIYCFMKSTD